VSGTVELTHWTEYDWQAVALCCWLITVLAATAARILIDFSTHDLRQYCRRRNRLAMFDQVMAMHDDVAISASILAVLAEFGAVASFTVWWLRAPATIMTWLGASLFVLLMVIAQVWIPAAIAAHAEAPFLFHTWRCWRTSHRLLAPLRGLGRLTLRIAARLAAAPHRTRDEEEEFEDEILSMVTAGQHDGFLEADAREMIKGIIELSDVDVAEIMTPRSQVEALEVKTGWDDLMAFVIRVRRTRIPVYEEKLDHVVGILHAKDLLPELLKPVWDRKSLRQLVREARKVPETKRVDELLREFRQTRMHMFIVLDEYQSVAGVVTIEDALEQIVGEIADEYDQVDPPNITWIDEDTAEVRGRAPLDQVNEELGLQLPPSDDYDTLAGWLVHHLRRIPDVGEEVQVDGVVAVVVEGNDRTVHRVRFHRLKRDAALSRHESAG